MRTTALCLLLITQLFSQHSTADFDWSDYNSLLSKYVISAEKFGIQTNLIDYQAFGKDPKFASLAERLALFDITTLTGAEKLSFYINTYNFLAIKLVVDHQPNQSIRDIGTWFSPVWQKPAGVLAGKTISLDTIEHKILRKMKEPRVHFAIVCGSISCPDLRKEAYNSKDLDRQLDEQAKLFLANKQKGMVSKGNKIFISKIFDWFSEDFSTKGSSAGVLKFIAQYNLEAGRFSHYQTLDYNWKLNQQ
jgi:hypothetical protein